MKGKELSDQSCLTLCHATDCSPLGSSVYGILQARKLEQVVILLFRYRPKPGMEPGSHALQLDSLPSEPAGS